MPDVSPHIGADRLVDGRYQLRRLIARGGMAEVWEGDDAVLGRPVAVKILLPHLAADQQFLDRFRNEAIAAARLGHPHVVATYDTGVDDGLAYIVMELVEGPNLREILTGPMLPERAVSIAAQAAEALDYAHQAGIVHRDVKPANILVCPGDRVKVADFGIAKAAWDRGGKDLTSTGAILGTAKYLSPEQVDGRPLDGRSDVYALGVVLYEMVCGRPPFTAETEMALGVQHLSHRPAPPRQVRPDVPPQLEGVILKALAKSPEDRHQSAGAFRSALLAADLQADDAVPSVERDDTPPAGMVIPSFGYQERSGRRWMVPAALALAVAVTLGTMAMLLVRSGRQDGPGPDGGSATAASIAEITAFDPEGDGEEHDSELDLLVDGDRSTSWDTQRYNSSRFGNLKPGVGFVLLLEDAHPLSQLRVTSATRGWTAEVALAARAGDDRDSWGPAVDRVEGVSGDATFDLGGKSAGAVLVWITDLGPGNSSVEISEIELA